MLLAAVDASNPKLNSINFTWPIRRSRARPRHEPQPFDLRDPQAVIETVRFRPDLVRFMRGTPAHVSGTMMLLPFAAGYLVASLAHPGDSTLVARLVDLVLLGSRDPGLLIAFHLVTFTLAQRPISRLLAHVSPAALQIAFLLGAASGALLLSVTHAGAAMLAGRALICVGSSGGFATASWAVLLCLRVEHRAIGNAVLVVCGSLGATASATSLDVILAALHWRVAFAALALATVSVVAFVWVLVPGGPASEQTEK